MTDNSLSAVADILGDLQSVLNRLLEAGVIVTAINAPPGFYSKGGVWVFIPGAVVTERGWYAVQTTTVIQEE